MSAKNTFDHPALEWLLEPETPGVRFLALRDLLDRSQKDSELLEARRAAHQRGPIAVVLDQMHPEGYWIKPGSGYNPKYFSTVWALILLAQLGAHVEEDERIVAACDYFLEHGLAVGGQIATSSAPSGTVDCLQGNLCLALLTLGVSPERLDRAYEWMARTVTGEGLASAQDRHAELRYYAGKCGPDFACGANDRKSCAWGGVKVMLALGAWPVERRDGIIERAIARGVNFFFSIDPATALYPSGYSDKPSSNWWKFGFPVFYITDILQIAEALSALGYARDPRLAPTIDLINSKQDPHGRWPLEYDYTGKTWYDFGPKKAANKWVTLRALRILKAAGRY